MHLKSCYFADNHMEGTPCQMCEQVLTEVRQRKQDIFPESVDPGLELAKRFPKYWKPLPAHWQAIDTYRINELFPVTGDHSGRILHSRKKLLVPGVRTGGKSLNTDISEAHATLGAWLDDNTPATETKSYHIFDGQVGCPLCHGTGLDLQRRACFCKRVTP